jgi:hypothetical protein
MLSDIKSHALRIIRALCALAVLSAMIITPPPVRFPQTIHI